MDNTTAMQDMTIYYSPSFTGECFRSPHDGPRFEKTVGDAGLLEFMELRLGLPGVESDAIDRILAYRKALGDVAPEAFYEPAFIQDPLATARELLRWRDLLAMEGFRADAPYRSPRLRKLAEAERAFAQAGLTGTPERWKAVCEAAGGGVREAGIVVCDTFRLLPALIRRALSAFGVTQGRCDGLTGRLPDFGGKKVSLLHFSTVPDAYRWASDQAPASAVICPDAFRLGAVLRGREMATPESAAAGDSPITQLFRLGLSLLERPVDIRNLRAYLDAGVSPIPGALRQRLSAAIRMDGGRGGRWDKALADWAASPDGEAARAALDRKATFLDAILDAPVSGDGTVSSALVTGWCGAMADWAGSRSADTRLTDLQRTFFAALSSLCRDMIRVVDAEGTDRIGTDFIGRAVKTLYSPVPVRATRSEAGSWEVLGSHRCFVDRPDSLLWIPCNGSLGTSYPYSFLLQEEAQELGGTPERPGLPTLTDFVRDDFNRMVWLLDGVSEITLCDCDGDLREALTEHPAVTVCKAAAQQTDLRGDDSRAGVFQPLRTLETGLDLYPVDRDGEDIPLSATSISTLVSYPFDFVAERRLHLRDRSDLGLPDLTLTQGTVAHYVFEKLMEDSGGDIAAMRRMLAQDSFGDRVLDAAGKRGAILLLREHRTLFFNFRETVRKSIGVLLDILDRCHITPLSSEEPIDERLDFARITGSVDFCAETKDKKLVVIDFKYSSGRLYIDSLKENESVQLELYAECLSRKRGRPVVAKAYYFFPVNQLHTDDSNGVFSGDNVFPHRIRETATSLSDRIRNSVRTRRDQLSAGILEVEEKCPLEEIEYHLRAGDGSLLDIPASGKKNERVKATNPFVSPAKFPILKNIIR